MCNGRRGVWTLRFSRRLDDWEIEIMERFLERLQNKVVVEGREDKVYWLETKSGTFSKVWEFSDFSTNGCLEYIGSI